MSVSAQEATGAMLRSDGTGVYVNGKPAPASIALFQDDLVQTQKAAAARLESTGSSADINPETIVQFEGDELVLDHGSLSVNTTRGLKVRVGCLTVTPVSSAGWTHYVVVDVDGKVTVSALKSDVNIDARSKRVQQAKEPDKSDRVSVREGEQRSREDKCGAGYANPSGVVAAQGAILNSPWAIGVGAAAIGGLTCWAVCRSDNPVSPTHP